MDYPVDFGLSLVPANVNSNGTDSPPWYRYNVWVSGTLCTAYGLVFCAGLLGNNSNNTLTDWFCIRDMSTGNLLVAVVVLRGSRTMRRCVTNLFLVNLAFADLLVVLACLPFTLVAHLIYRKWISFFFVCFVLSFTISAMEIFWLGPKNQPSSNKTNRPIGVRHHLTDRYPRRAVDRPPLLCFHAGSTWYYQGNSREIRQNVLCRKR